MPKSDNPLPRRSIVPHHRGMFGSLVRVSAFLALPIVPIAARMHYSREFRENVERTVPGSVGVLSKITGSNYKMLNSEEETGVSTESAEERRREENNAVSRRSSSSSSIEGPDGASGEPADQLSFSQMSSRSAKNLKIGRDLTQRIKASDGVASSTDGIADSKVGAVEVNAKNEQHPVSDEREVAILPKKDVTEKILRGASENLREGHSGVLEVQRSERPDSTDASRFTGPLQNPSHSDTLNSVGSESGTRPLVPRLPTSAQLSSPSAERKDTVSFNSTDIAKLEAQVKTLRVELESQNRWEGFRIQEAINAQAIQEKRNAAKAAAEAEKKFAEEKSSAIAKVQHDAERSFAQKLADVKREADEEIQGRVDKAIQEREKTLRLSVESELTLKAKVESDKRVEELGRMKGMLGALEKEFEVAVEQRKAAHKSSQISAMIFAMRDKVEETTDFADELQEVGKTEFGKVVTEALPSSSAPTTSELRAGFTTVGREGRRAALLPHDKSDSVWAHVLATIASKIKIGIDNFGLSRLSDEPKTNEEKIRRAERLIADGKLSEGVCVLNEVDGLAKDIIGDWLTAAKYRLAANQAAKMLQTNAILTQIALSSVKAPSA